jgi:hypothetical protein
MSTIKFFSLITVIALHGFSSAQNDDIDNREKVKFGFKIGTNYSNVFDEKNDDFKAEGKFGFAGGTMLSIPINKYFGIKPELVLSQKGFKGQGTLLGSTYNFTRSTTFLDVPIQLEFKPSEFLSIVAGPQFSYLLKQKDVFSNSALSFSQEQEFQNDNIRKNIFGFVGGIDINIKQVTIGARAGFDFNSNHGEGSSSTPRYKNVWLQATLGYTFYKKNDD